MQSDECCRPDSCCSLSLCKVSAGLKASTENLSKALLSTKICHPQIESRIPDLTPGSGTPDMESLKNEKYNLKRILETHE